MSNNKLNLLVQFTGIDKLSGGLKNIIGASKASTQSLRTMRQEVRENEKELKRVRDLLNSGSTSSGLVLAQESLSRAIAETNRKIDAQKQKLERVANIEKRFSGIAATAGKIGTVASVSVTAPLVAFGQHAFKAAMDAEELKSAFNVTFGSNAAAMQAWAAKTGTLLDRTQVELMEAAKTFGIFFKESDPKNMAKLSQQMTVLAQDLSSFHNVNPAVALQKLQSGLTGESEPLRDFGIMMNDAAVKSQALKMGMKLVDNELTEQQKILARTAFIMANAKDANGDLIRTSGSTANQLRASQTAWANLSMTIGQELVPALTPAIKLLTSAIKSFSGMDPVARKWVVVIGAAAAVVGPLLIGVAGIAAGLSALAPVVAAVGGAFSLAALPIVAGVALLAGAAYVIYSNWSAISGFFTSTWSAIAGVFTRNWTTIRNVALGAMVIFTPMVAAAVWLGVQIYRNWDMIKAKTMGLISYIGGIVQPFIQPFVEIISYIERLKLKFFSFGVNIVSGLINGITSMAGSVLRAIVNLAGSVGAKFAETLGIKSPSRLFMAMGSHINYGLRIGLDRGTNGPIRAVGRMAGAVAGAGAMALSPAAAARPNASGATSVVNQFHITQQPGEDANTLAERVARLVEQAQRGKALRSFGDD